MMHFDEAINGWTSLSYKLESGIKSKQGDLTHPGFLGCSGFVSIVYHRMRYGDEWLKRYDFLGSSLFHVGKSKFNLPAMR